ncbi:hypothetical protein FACS189491_00100 [Spirochaetia bacterium]|nr:hypothetical protein FACS189491_00100 [Spirochaetia bacterium]
MKKFLLCLAFVMAGVFVSAQTGGNAESDTANDLAIQSRIQRLKMQGLIPMRFANALDGSPISGALVKIDGIGNFTTNNEGLITFPEQEDDFYTLTFLKAGYITTAITFEVKLNNVFGNRYSISPDLPRGFRIVLDWGEKPSDLDLHLEKSQAPGGAGYHISFWNMHTAEDEGAALDRDDRNSYGPETITIERSGTGAVYDVYVIDYTSSGSASSRTLSQSGAVVRVYGDGRLLNTFTVPQNRSGSRWDVCRIERGRVTSVNRVN